MLVSNPGSTKTSFSQFLFYLSSLSINQLYNFYVSTNRRSISTQFSTTM